MKALICCEYSDTVGSAFRSLGYYAKTNDILPTEGDPRNHIQGDCVDAIRSQRWDRIVIHIPCTAMCLAGNSTYGIGMPKHQERLERLNGLCRSGMPLANNRTMWRLRTPPA